jgi:glyoxylase-like metal-dependent hydrolase (beta-lactamase superfamily II)
LLVAGSEAVLIDPGEEWERFLAALEQRGARLAAIWLTHAHLDHILGVGEVQRATGAPIWLHPADRSLYDDLPAQAMWLGMRVPAAPPPQHELAHGQVLSIGDFRFAVRHTPGHSPGSVSLVGSEVVFSGDALFQGSIGRSDLPGGDHDTLIASIRRELLSLPDATRVLSGHGPETTIAAERRTNPFLR